MHASPRYSAEAGARAGHPSPVAESSALNDEPSEPKVTAQPCPIEGIMTALNGVNPRPIKQGRGHRDRDAKSACALQEGGKNPADQQRLHTTVAGKRGQQPADRLDSSCFFGNAVQQESRPGDEKNVHRENKGLGVRKGQHVCACAEEDDGNEKRSKITCRAGASRAPSKTDHEDEDNQDGKGCDDGHSLVVLLIFL